MEKIIFYIMIGSILILIWGLMFYIRLVKDELEMKIKLLEEEIDLTTKNKK